MSRAPIFLERGNYRLRRMMDAVRLLPFLGLALWLVPVFWPLPETAGAAAPEPVTMSVALRYVFGVWAALVLAAWLLWRRTSEAVDAAPGPAERPD